MSDKPLIYLASASPRQALHIGAGRFARQRGFVDFAGNALEGNAYLAK
jgi:hypothetical protein